jgi:hypothetical protein
MNLIGGRTEFEWGDPLHGLLGDKVYRYHRHRREAEGVASSEVVICHICTRSYHGTPRGCVPSEDVSAGSSTAESCRS